MKFHSAIAPARHFVLGGSVILCRKTFSLTQGNFFLKKKERERERENVQRYSPSL
jgi:hypothetical protein